MTRALPVYFFLVLFVFFQAPVQGVQFDQKYSVTYLFDPRGNATVSKKVTLTNLDENIYPSEYVLDIPEDATNIAAFDQLGKLELEVGHKDNKKLAKLILNSQNIGISNNTEIALVYETRQLVQGNGDNRTITIPPLLSSGMVASAMVTVELPPEWGAPDHMIPPPVEPFIWRDSAAAGGIQIQYLPGAITNIPDTPTAPENHQSSSRSYMPYLGLVVGGSIVGLGFIFSKLLNKL